MSEKKAKPPLGPVAAPDAPAATVAPAMARAAVATQEAAAQASTAGFAAAASTASSAGAAAQETARAAFPGFLKDFDFTKLFGEMKATALPDMEAVLTTHKRNLEALSDANRVALEGAQAVARRHMEIMQSTMAELTQSVKSLSVSEPPASRAARQAEMLKSAYENAVSNTREIGDLIQRSNTEAMQKLNRRFSEAMNEVKTLFKKH